MAGRITAIVPMPANTASARTSSAKPSTRRFLGRFSAIRMGSRAPGTDPGVIRQLGPGKCQLEDRNRIENTQLSGPEPLQNRDRRKSVGNQPAAGLEVAHPRSRLDAEAAVRLPDVEAEAVEVLLEFKPLSAAEHALLARPGLHD